MKKLVAVFAALSLVVVPTASAGMGDGGLAKPNGWSWNG